MSLPTVTVTASYKAPDGAPAKGRVVFRLLAALVDVNDNILIRPSTVSVPLDVNGALSHALVPSDAVGLAPTPVAYHVTEQVPAGRDYIVLIPSANPTVRLSELVPLDAPPPTPPAAFQLLAQRGKPDGYASLDSAGKVPVAQLPAVVINDTFPVASQVAMLALAAQRGDVAVRTDLGESFILAADDPTVLANWLELPAAGHVLSVNGQTGVAVLTATDVGADPAGAAAAGDATTLTAANRRAAALGFVLGV